MMIVTAAKWLLSRYEPSFMDARVFTTVKGKRLVGDAATAATAAAVRSPPVGMRPFHRAFYTFLMELKWVMSCEQITERHSRFFFFHFFFFFWFCWYILCLCPLVFHIEKDKLASKMLICLFASLFFCTNLIPHLIELNKRNRQWMGPIGKWRDLDSTQPSELWK